MLIDAFLYNGETEMLLFRLKMLPMVDKFIIVESDRKFNGDPKPWYTDSLDERFDPYREKIIIHPVISNIKGLNFKKPEGFDQTADCWKIERQQRDCITAACEIFPEDTLVLMGDVDEIPSREALEYALGNNVRKDNPVPFGQFVFYYNLKFLRDATITGTNMQAVMWGATVITDVKTLLKRGAQKIRDERKNSPHTITSGGWHLSYFDNPEGIKHKIETFSHQELNEDKFKDDNHIAHCIQTGADLFDRGTPVVPMAKEFFPKYFRDNAPKEWWL